MEPTAGLPGQPSSRWKLNRLRPSSPPSPQGRDELREIDGTLYANDGDRVESLTALVEHQDGRLELIDWSKHLRERLWLDPLTELQAARAPGPLPGGVAASFGR